FLEGAFARLDLRFGLFDALLGFLRLERELLRPRPRGLFGLLRRRFSFFAFLQFYLRQQFPIFFSFGGFFVFDRFGFFSAFVAFDGFGGRTRTRAARTRAGRSTAG